jgi:thioesterase domain-containing protein
MARQLAAVDEVVAAVLMIDTRLPPRVPYQAPYSFLDWQRIRFINNRRSGTGGWDLVRRALRRVTGVAPSDRGNGSDDDLPPIKERSERIHRAFVRACASYEVPKLGTRLLYFRPGEETAYRLPSGTIDFVDGHPHRVDGRENGWGPYFDEVMVRTVPGGHYTLAHAPNATHLAEAMVRELRSLGFPAAADLQGR